MRKLVTLSLSCLTLIFCATSALAQGPPGSLISGPPVERELSGGQVHAYTLRMAAGQIACVTAEQQSINVVVSVIAPDGVKLFQVDSPNRFAGDETATIAAKQSGLYRIEIRPADNTAAAGRYAIRLDKFLTESEFVAERLAAVGRLWGLIKYFHPYLAYKDIDWDGALVRSLPQIKAARTPGEYRHAIGSLLDVLNDPATAVVPVSIDESDSPPSSTTPKAPAYFRIVDDHVIIIASDWAEARAAGDTSASAKQQPMMSEIAKAKGIVVDCRYNGTSPTDASAFYLRFYLNSVLPLLVQDNVLLGTQRYRTHSGYAPQRGSSSGGYTSTFATQAPDAIVGLARIRKPLAVVIDEKTPDLVPLLSGLQAADARIIQVGKSSREANAQTHRMMLADGVEVRVRMSEFVDATGGSTFHPDLEIPGNSGDDRVISSAIGALDNHAIERAATTTTSVPAPTLQSLKDHPYLRMSFPSEEYRLLALFRFWNTIDYFFPYKHLTDKPWDTVLTAFIPRFLENKNQLDYEMTIAEMVARLQDTHGFVGPLKSLDEHLGVFAPPLTLRMASGKLTVVSLPDEKAAQAAGVKVGDSIIAVDGEPIEQRIEYLSKFKSLSNSASAYHYVHPTALRGAKDSKVKLRIERADGQVSEVEMARSIAFGYALVPSPRKTPIYQVLAN
ncbi:MAG TPA: hypothetical protein VFV34_18510, partial [Blastocatellia bacterium]|nr:hypothetical protein [Blastocatellia bacterium]